MFVFVFAGELFAFIVNGDRFELLALLPRRKARTDRTVQPPSCSRNSTSPAPTTALRLCLWMLAWISFSAVTPLPFWGLAARGAAVSSSSCALLWLRLRDTATGAEAEARERTRRRKGRIHRQRGQVRVVSVEAAPESPNRPLAGTGS